jgi:hypothetical protein
MYKQEKTILDTGEISKYFYGHKEEQLKKARN